ncbi:hypothetical protein ATCC90586_004133 [Pythium insidiosum]|nr:hypothetical protein ATCC90586_004133 [Pythium insidiosum]
MRIPTLLLAAAAVVARAQALDGRRFAVTAVRMVQGTSRDDALELCQRDGRSLCQERQPLDAIAPAASVVENVAVFTGSSTCPSPAMTLLASPRPNVAVCVTSTTAQDARATGHYVSDLAVTTVRNYNTDDLVEWTTSPINLKAETTPSAFGAFLHVRRPVRAISALRVLNKVDASQTATACQAQLGSSWRSAGNGFLDAADGKTVLCAKTLDPADTTTPRLIGVSLAGASASCDDGPSPDKLALSASAVLALEWSSGAVAPRARFIADLRLHRVDTAFEGDDPTAAEFLPGRFKLVANQNLNSERPTFLFVRDAAQPQSQFVVPTAPERPPLQAVAKSSGLSFKILQLADLHYTGFDQFPCLNPPAGLEACTEATMTQFVNDLLDVEKPDFVVFTGDNVQVFQANLRQAAMDAATAGVEARKIPYAMVFGNHDDENGFPREEIVRIAMSKPHSYTQRGPSDVDGVGNYELGVKAPADGPWGARGTDVFRMYFLDSHGYPDRTKYPLVSSSYDWVKPSQIEFYEQLSRAHAKQNATVPAAMFFHIPLIEYAANAKSRTAGAKNEAVASSSVNTNLFSTIVDRGEVKATFVGHDHVNDYCYLREGVQLCYGGGAGLGSAYGGRDFPRRARVIEWAVNGSTGKRSLRSWKRYFGDLSKPKDEEVLFQEP